MRKSKSSESQIVGGLKKAEQGGVEGGISQFKKQVISQSR
jgi:hypothetical protein